MIRKPKLPKLHKHERFERSLLRILSKGPYTMDDDLADRVLEAIVRFSVPFWGAQFGKEILLRRIDQYTERYRDTERKFESAHDSRP